jgi:hypothetical protein
VRLGFGVSALILIKRSEVVERGADKGELEAGRILGNRERALGLGIAGLHLK